MKHHDPERKNDIEAAERTLAEALLCLQTHAEARKFLEDLCTPAEIEAMVDRWRVAQLLDTGRSYREIAAMTGVSVTTIGRVARYLEHGAEGYRTILNRLGSENR